MLQANAWLMVAYVVSGRLGLLLALPPGYASAIFPPAGIAVAAVLIGGMRLLPGVFAGSLLLNLWIGSESAQGTDTVAFAAASIIALASVLQAAAGGWLLRRVVGYPAPLDGLKEVGSFLVASPVICLVSATVSVAGLAALGLLTSGSIPINWVTWWIGDSIGVLVLLPLTMVVAGEPRALWRRRARVVAAPMLVGFGIFTAIYVLVNGWEEDQSLQEFRMLSERLASEIEAELEAQVITLEQLERFFSRDEPVTRREFRYFVQTSLARYPNVQALGWDPRVTSAERAAFERAQSVDLPGFQILERTPAGMLVRAGERDEYFPVTYIEPDAGNEDAAGFDIASSPDRRETIEAAFRQRAATVTPPLRLVQEPESQAGLLVLMPVFDGEARKGVLVAVIRAGDFVTRLQSAARTDLRVRFSDAASGATLFDELGPSGGSTMFDRVLRFGGRDFRLETSPTPEYLATHRGWESWSLLAAGLFWTGLLGALFMLSSGYTSRVEASESRVRQIVETSMDAVVTMNGAGVITGWSPQAQAIFGWERTEAVGRDLAELIIPEEQRDSHRAGLRRFQETGEGPVLNRRVELIALRKGGARFPVEVAISPLRIDGDLEFSGFVRDIAERKQAEDFQLRAQKLEALGTLAGGIAHDFNNILLAISGNTKLAAGEVPPAHPAQRNLEEIARASTRAADLVRQILTFSRPQERAVETVQLRSVVEEALRLLRATLPAMIEIRGHFSPDTPAVAADATQIHQVVVNLVTNAAYAIGRRAGSIDVRLERVVLGDHAGPADLRPGVYCRLSVADDGSGMDRATLERVFDPFFTTKSPAEGTGLGLSVVHGIVKGHKGAISVDSTPGTGTTFHLYFPAVAGASRAPAAGARKAGRGRGERVLYVDDDQALVLLATRMLGKLGYDVTARTGTDSGLQEFRSRPGDFDAVITDLSMPGMSGLDFARALLALRPGLPIILTSGYLRPEDEEAAREIGIREVILKPTTVDELGHAMDRLFRSHGTTDTADSTP